MTGPYGQETPESRADELLKIIVESQPNLLSPNAFGEMNGKAAGEFIAGLRSRLIEMYQQTPQR